MLKPGSCKYLKCSKMYSEHKLWSHVISIYAITAALKLAHENARNGLKNLSSCAFRRHAVGCVQLNAHTCSTDANTKYWAQFVYSAVSQIGIAIFTGLKIWFVKHTATTCVRSSLVIFRASMIHGNITNIKSAQTTHVGTFVLKINTSGST